MARLSSDRVTFYLAADGKAITSAVSQSLCNRSLVEPTVSPNDHAAAGWMVWSLIEHVKALSAKMGSNLQACFRQSLQFKHEGNPYRAGIQSPVRKGVDLFCRTSCSVYSASLSEKAAKTACCGGAARVTGDGRFRVNKDLDEASHPEGTARSSIILNRK